jgi:hypothetical protein
MEEPTAAKEVEASLSGHPGEATMRSHLRGRKRTEAVYLAKAAAAYSSKARQCHPPNK